MTDTNPTNEPKKPSTYQVEWMDDGIVIVYDEGFFNEPVPDDIVIQFLEDTD